MVSKMASLIQNWLRMYRQPQATTIFPGNNVVFGFEFPLNPMLLKIMDSSFLYLNHWRRLKTQMLTCLSEAVVLGGEEILMKGFARRPG